MNLFAKPLYIYYNSRLLSEATIFFIIITLIRFLLPLIIVWRTDSFWIKESSYREMPDIDFKKNFILLLNVQTIADQDEQTIGFSTIDTINRILDNDEYLIPINIAQYEYDYDNDHRYDELKLILDIPVDLNQNYVRGFRLLTFFQYRLSERIHLEMESLADLIVNDHNPGQYVRIEGHLELVQRKPFHHRGYEFGFNHSIIPLDEKIHLENILLQYSRRKYFTRIKVDYKHWQSYQSILNAKTKHPFRLEMTIYYQDQLFRYNTGFWYLIKWALVQYLAVFIIIDYFIHWIQCLVFDGYLVATIPRIQDVGLLNSIFKKKQF